jgi:dolichol-phosphate mannosyltransferase
MRLSENPASGTRSGSVSLILPLVPGRALPSHEVAVYRQILEEDDSFESVEVVISRGSHALSRNPDAGPAFNRFTESRSHGKDVLHVVVEGEGWSLLARAGMLAATGDYLIVLDLERRYSPELLARLIEPVCTGEGNLSVAVAHNQRSLFLRWSRSRFGLGLVSRFFLGTSDAFSGLFAVRRSDWVSVLETMSPKGSSLVLDMLIRSKARCIDVPVNVDDQFQSRLLGFRDLRQLKHMLDRRFGNYSRLAQFCCVGASGMFVDLSFYALLQWLLSFTWLASTRVAFLGSPSHLAIARVLAIGIALVWNFALNRRLTFNDARKGDVFRQFLTYALSNAIAIFVSLTLSLVLPAKVPIFASHRLAAAVVGIVLATGISFSMSRWLVFGRRPPDRKPPSYLALDPQVGEPSSVI